VPRPAERRKQHNRTGTFMNLLTTKGQWNIAKGKLKQRFAQLVDDDLQFIEGKQDELTGRIQKRSGQGREHIQCAADEGCGCHH